MARVSTNRRTILGPWGSFGRAGTPCWSALVVLATLGACSNTSSEYYDPLSDECDDCLSTGGEEGCESLWRACDEVPGCADYVLCQVRARCYAEASDSGCEQRVGCEFAEDAADGAEEAAAEFEACARAECRDACDYVAP